MCLLLLAPLALGFVFLTYDSVFFIYGLAFVAYGNWLGVFLLMVEFRFGLFFFAYGGKSVWSFLLTVAPRGEIRFGLSRLRFPRRK